MNVEVHGYVPHRDQAPADATIRITGQFREPEDHEPGWEQRAREKFKTDARLVYDALWNNLPGGTMHELLICMLEGKLNILVVKEEVTPNA